MTEAENMIDLLAILLNDECRGIKGSLTREYFEDDTKLYTFGDSSMILQGPRKIEIVSSYRRNGGDNEGVISGEVRSTTSPRDGSKRSVW